MFLTLLIAAAVPAAAAAAGAGAEKRKTKPAVVDRAPPAELTSFLNAILPKPSADSLNAQNGLSLSHATTTESPPSSRSFSGNVLPPKSTVPQANQQKHTASPEAQKQGFTGGRFVAFDSGHYRGVPIASKLSVAEAFSSTRTTTTTSSALY